MTTATKTDHELGKAAYLKSGGKEEDFERDAEEVSAEVSQDLDIPSFCETIRLIADRFKQQIFPAPKLTAAALRAKRLGWMQ